MNLNICIHTFSSYPENLIYVCLYMLAAARAVGAGERPSSASRLSPSELRRSLQQLHPERRRAVHLSSTWIQVKHRFTSTVSV